MSGRTDTWMPIYWGDYLKDTGHLGAVEHGTYLLLLGHYWVTGEPLPDDDYQLKNISKNTAHIWKKIRPIIEKFFIVKDGVWRHKRVDEELAKAVENREKRSEKATKAAEARWNKPDATSTPQAKPQECPSPSPSPKKEKIYKKENPDFEEIKKWWNEKGLTVSIDLEWEKYQLWLQTNGKRHKNKTAGFKNWLLKAQEFSRDGPDAPRSTEQAVRDREQAAATKDSFVRSEIKSAEKLAARYNEPLESYLPGIAKQAGVELAFVEARVDATPAIPEQFRRTA